MSHNKLIDSVSAVVGRVSFWTAANGPNVGVGWGRRRRRGGGRGAQLPLGHGRWSDSWEWRLDVFGFFASEGDGGGGADAGGRRSSPVRSVPRGGRARRAHPPPRGQPELVEERFLDVLQAAVGGRECQRLRLLDPIRGRRRGRGLPRGDEAGVRGGSAERAGEDGEGGDGRREGEGVRHTFPEQVAWG